mgnify:CR=1 FL=1
MRIIRVEHGGTSYYGILEDGLVFRLHRQPGRMEPTPLSETTVLPLVTPSKVVCVGLNYKAHARGAWVSAAADAEFFPQAAEQHHRQR